MTKAKITPDIACGGFLLLAGAFGGYFGARLPLGTSSQMGPGYFPLLISGALALVGIIILARGILAAGPPVPRIAVSSTAIVVLSIAAFALCIERFGLAPAVFVSVVISLFAMRERRLVEGLILAGALAIAMVILFVYLLNQPIESFRWRG